MESVHGGIWYVDYLDSDNSFSIISSCFRVRAISASASCLSAFSSFNSLVSASRDFRSWVVATDVAVQAVGDSEGVGMMMISDLNV